jgi:hypothetical protein
MGLLTTEHGKAGYLADFFLYAAASATMGVLLAVVSPYVRHAEMLAFALLGLVAWTLVEYVLHRFVLHGIQPFRAWHAEHHRRPRALIGTPTILSAALIAALVFNAGRSYYDQLLQDGVNIFERRDALLHAKTAVIDGVWSTVGSTNLDWRSFLHNQELNAVVLGTEFGERMRTAFAGDIAQSEQIALEQWRKRSMALRLKEQFARLWQYWL